MSDSIGEGHDLAGQTALRATDSFRFQSPFWAPAPCNISHLYRSLFQLFFADGITHLDSPVESFESLPDCLDSGEWLALRWVGADEASAVDDEGSDVGWHSGGHVEDFTVALEGQQGEQEPDVPFGLDIGRRGLWTFPRAHGDVGDMAGGDGVEGEAFAQVVGGVESAVRDAGAGLEGFEPCLHGPPFPVPVQHGGGVDGVGFPLCRACGREQQPVQRLRAVGGVGLGGGDGAHRQRFRALPLLPRRQERDLRDPDFQAGGARLSGPRASGGRDDQFRHRDGGPGRGVRPQAPLPPVRCLHPPGRRGSPRPWRTGPAGGPPPSPPARRGRGRQRCPGRRHREDDRQLLPHILQPGAPHVNDPAADPPVGVARSPGLPRGPVDIHAVIGPGQRADRAQLQPARW